MAATWRWRCSDISSPSNGSKTWYSTPKSGSHSFAAMVSAYRSASLSLPLVATTTTGRRARV